MRTGLLTDDSFSVSPWVMSAERRGLDIVVAVPALLILLPAMLLVMLLVRVSSPGPVFFRQRRTGRDREEFTLYKFRSMRVENSPGPAITVSGDSRITPIGVLLRRYKLDELPQFWNVLKGNMSLVGPRPKLPHHEGLDLPYRPGITGMATLVFRNEEKILSDIPHDQLDAFYESCVKPRKALLDMEYMRSATFWTDLKLLWSTATSCFFGSGNLSLEETGKLIRFAAAWPDPPCDPVISSSAMEIP
jgi:lipopolysaccharide/colanic/teichoic acid biosynthesis glycosyltransferase